MPLRRLTGRERSESANWQLAALLAFVAGAADVSGYLALHQFTSHMSGIVAALAADVAMRGMQALVSPAVTLLSFLAGAMVCALLINWSRRRERESLYAVPVLLEALTLASLCLPGVHSRFLVLLVLLAFSMGLQNAIITKISQAEIRTTHVTGMITDIGIELGKALYWNRHHDREPVRADQERLRMLGLLVGLFFAGGAVGAFAYPRVGFALMGALAVLLALLTVRPIATDLITER